MTDYTELSDFEINKAVAEALYPDYQWFEVSEIHGLQHVDDDNKNWVLGYDNNDTRSEPYTYDYCNNWSDCGPIIEEHGITILPDGAEWAATNSVAWNSGPNPKRCAMIVFLETRGYHEHPTT